MGSASQAASEGGDKENKPANSLFNSSTSIFGNLTKIGEKTEEEKKEEEEEEKLR